MVLALIAKIGLRVGPSYISRMVSLGYSGASIVRRIETFNWGVSKSWVYGRVRTYAQRQITGARIAKYATDKLLPVHAMSREYISRGRNYKIMVGIGDYDKANKTWSQGYKTFYSDDGQSIDEWTREAIDKSILWEDSDPLQEGNFTIINITKNLG